MKQLILSVIFFAIATTSSDADGAITLETLFSNTQEFNSEIDFGGVQAATRPEAYYRE